MASAPVVEAQSNAVPWSAFDAGSAVAFTGSTRVISVVGQSFTGNANTANDGIKSGFLVYPFRSPLSSGIRANGGSEAPTTYELSQNYPNPFNPTTGVRFQVPGVSDVKLIVYDILGREVATLVNERKAAGRYEVRFDASGLASGVYIYRLTAGSFVQTRKMILLK
jgi:hypothetical protein